MTNLPIIKKKFSLLVKIIRIVTNKLDKANKCILCLIYGYRYGIFGNNKQKLIKIILSLVTNQFNYKKLQTSCKVKPSKIIFDRNDKELFIFDRPIPNFYFDLREKFSYYHQAPNYLKVDKKSYLQNKIIYNKNLLSLSKSDQYNLIKGYLHKQLELKKNYGIKVSSLKFFGEPLSFVKDRGELDYFPSLFKESINSIKKKNEISVLVPSVIEPWPIIQNNTMFFSDLSPVEFREAPFLHDLLYMLFKHELYGNRENKNKGIFKIIFNALKKVDDNKEEEINEIELLSLAKLIHQIVNPKKFIDAYVMMIVLHSYVKFYATGKFTNSSAKYRFELALKRHAKIFELAIC